MSCLAQERAAVLALGAAPGVLWGPAAVLGLGRGSGVLNGAEDGGLLPGVGFWLFCRDCLGAAVLRGGVAGRALTEGGGHSRRDTNVFQVTFLNLTMGRWVCPKCE